MKRKTVSSGIGFTLNEAALKSHEPLLSKIIGLVSQFFIICACSIGGILTFTGMMGVKLHIMPVTAAIAVAAALFIFLYNRLSSALWPNVAICAALAVVALIFSGSLTSAAKIIYDDCRTAIAKAMFWSVPDRLVEYDSSSMTYVTLLVCLAAVLVTIAVTYFTAKRVFFPAVFLITFPLFELGAAYGCVPDRYIFALLISGWAGVIVLHKANRSKARIKMKSGKRSHSTKQFTRQKRAGKFASSALLMTLVVFIVFSTAQTALVQNGFERSESLVNMRLSIKENVSNIIDLITGVDNDGSLKEGRLYEMGDRIIKKRHYMTAVLPKTKNPLYIKGYVGSTYTGSQWEDIKDYSKYESFFKKLEELGFSSPTMTGDLLDSSDFGGELNSFTVSVSDLRRQKDYIYQLYSSKLNSELMAIYDKTVGFKSAGIKNNYSYFAYYKPSDQFRITLSDYYDDDTVSSFRAAYTQFVRESYTALPDGAKKSIPAVSNVKGKNMYELVDIVRKYLADNAEYSLNSKKLPADKDFVEYFLTTNTGYSAHYATAAAVMLRALGVPARYIEGYYVGTDDIKSAPTAEQGGRAVEITDANAHAWIEVYDAAYGWIAVDVTPGYYGQSFVDFVSASIEQAKQNKYDDKSEEEEEVGTSDDKEIYDEGVKDEIEKPEKKPVKKDDADKPDNPIGKILLYIAYSVIALLLLTALLYAVLAVRRGIAEKRRKKALLLEPRERVTACFEWFIDMLGFNGLRAVDYNSYAELIKYIKEKSEFIPNENLEKIVDVFLKAGYSKEQITEQQAAQVVDFVTDYNFGMHDALGFWRKLKFKYIDNLK